MSIRPGRKTLITVAVVIIGVVIAGRFGAFREAGFFLRNAQLGSALVAHDLCYGVLLQGRSEEHVRNGELGPFIDDRLSWFSADIDQDNAEIRTSLYGLFSIQYGMRADGSCSRYIEGEGRAPGLPAPDPRPWPTGDAIHPAPQTLIADYDALVEAVEAEFEPFPSGQQRGTRSVLIIHEGALIYERHAPGWDRFIPQNGQSNTKVVTAILAGALADQNSSMLEDRNLRPEWEDQRTDITIRNLLHMTSGLDWNESNADGDPGVAKLLSENAADYVAAKPLRNPPGQRFNYSGGDSDLLMSVLQTKSGLNEEAWSRFPYDTIFEPLGMQRTVLSRDTSGQFIGQGSMHAAAVDWGRLGLFLARDGVWEGERILPVGWVDFMTTPTETSRCNYGAQLWIRGGCETGGPAEVFELSGFMGQSVTIVPATETVIVRTGFGPWRTSDLLSRVFPALGVDAPTLMAREMAEK